MGCGASTNASTNDSAGKNDMLWIAGQSCAGKTFLGDYLATRGYHHIDGDMGNQTTDESLKNKWQNFFKAMAQMAEKGKADEALWKPYYEFLVEQFKEGQKLGKPVVLSFAILNLFGERQWIARQLPGVRFMKVDVKDEEILERALVRNKKLVTEAGGNFEEMWEKDDQFAEARQHFGEKYTDEGYREATKAHLFAVNYIVCKPTDKWITYVPNNNLKDGEGIKSLNKILGLEDKPVDFEAIAQVNYDRMKNLNLDAGLH